MAEEQTLDNPLESLPPEVYANAQGLLWLGHIEETVELAGHTFTLRTLKMSEQLDAGLIAKEYLESIGQVDANSWAQVAASLVAVDGDPNFCPPISNNDREWIRAKFNYITKNWFPPVGQFLFSQYFLLLEKQMAAIQAVENLSKRSLSSSWLSPDFLERAESSLENSTDSNEVVSPISSE